MQFIFNRLRLTLEEEEDIQKISIPQFQGLTSSTNISEWSLIMIRSK